MSGDINKAYQWAIKTCNDPDVGYSMDYRGQTINGKTYYDCSAFIWYALKAGGFDLASVGSTWAFTTDTMCAVLESLGFKEILLTSEWKKGDILWRDGHTEMVYEGYVTMGAHTDSYAWENQVSISSYTSDPSNWTRLYRYGDGATVGSYEWIYYDTDEAGKMSQSDQENNVMIIFSELYTKYGWTREAIAGALGSMQIESYFNPAQWELGHKSDTVDGYGFGYGYGLIQWTRPASNYPNPYLDYCYTAGVDRLDGSEQLRYLNIGIESSNLWGWIPTSAYPLTFSEYISSTESPEYLASAWLYNLERPSSNTTESTRQEYARFWYDWLADKSPIEPSTPETERKKKGLSKLLLFAIATDRF